MCYCVRMGLRDDISTYFRRQRLTPSTLSTGIGAPSIWGILVIAAPLFISACMTQAGIGAGAQFSSSQAAVSYYLNAEAKNRALNAYVFVDAESARQQAQAVDSSNATPRVLKGWVFAVKDNIHVAGMPNSAGTNGLRKFRPKESSSVVERLQSEGAVILGKTNMHELAYGVTNNNFAFGPARNPIDLTRIPGGSSG